MDGYHHDQKPHVRFGGRAEETDQHERLAVRLGGPYTDRPDRSRSFVIVPPIRGGNLEA